MEKKSSIIITGAGPRYYERVATSWWHHGQFMWKSTGKLQAIFNFPWKKAFLPENIKIGSS